MTKKIPLPSLKRLPKYYSIVCEYYKEGKEYIKSSEISKKLDIDETQVRKDIALLNCAGKPKVGFNINELKRYLEEFLDINNMKDSFLIGTGNLGLAIAKYNGFEKYGLNITALFDTDPHKIGLKVGEKEIFHVSKFPDLAQRMRVKIIILAVPREEAQKMADIAVKAGAKAIWNFAPANIDVPKDVLVINQDLATDFMVLWLQLHNKDLSI
ncbi:MAG TPA: redox-sensing transcriptional repressor Rex [Cyanobacteria bacterium UBA9971]|nr:redox-sensing transcriptional repressor Rex [Cyanobacteria bacterium UBA9971]